MAARAGMANLISELRGMTDAGTADYTITGISSPFWPDDLLQNVLDQHRRDVRREPLMMASGSVGSGSVEYRDYYFRHPHVEEADGGTVWIVEDSTGAHVGTSNYTVNYHAQHIRFNANTGGRAYYLTYRHYDLNRAAAQVWQDKAAHVASRFDLKIDNHDLKRSQLRAAYLQMAAEYRSRAGGRSIERVRGDMNA